MLKFFRIERQFTLALLAAIFSLAVTPMCTSALAAAPSAGTTFRDCNTDCPEMVVLPRGSFRMGSVETEAGRQSEMEDPRHRVVIDYDFAVGKYEVTRDEYAQFVHSTGRADPAACNIHQPPRWPTIQGLNWHETGFAQTGRHPAVCVSWKDAEAYVSWLTQKTGRWYYLLSEAEWEYAARAGTTTADYWGDSQKDACTYANGADLTMKAQFVDQQAAQPCEDGYVYTAPVGSFKPNAFGLYDMLGNVFEMLADCYERTYRGAPPDGSAKITAECRCRSNRGGSWTSTPTGLRAAYRDCDQEDTRVVDLGFRVAVRL